ncbi:MAG: DNA polymerase III subunit epsilon [Rhodocyclaceae bacterium]|nr:DNA polymerase III subunit epsilon [Rhodocyclaceae bacterium]
MLLERKIVLDTETTGLDFRLGHRVIEIGCIEIVGRKPTGRQFHRYLNPERDIDAGAVAVHGLTNEFLADRPKFKEVADELIDFLRDAELLIHNAPFDMGFLNQEMKLLDKLPLDKITTNIVDTLKMAKEHRPGRKNSLDALCTEYGVNNANRKLHGALLDAELLAEVWLAMTRGQENLLMTLDRPDNHLLSASEGNGTGFAGISGMGNMNGEKRPILILRADGDEVADHERTLKEIFVESKGHCHWLMSANCD